MADTDKKDDTSEPRRARPTDHVDYFVIDDADLGVFAHAPDRIVRTPPTPKTRADLDQLKRQALGLDDDNPTLSVKPRKRK